MSTDGCTRVQSNADVYPMSAITLFVVTCMLNADERQYLLAGQSVR